MGKSGHIGRKIAATLASTGTPFWVTTLGHLQKMGAAVNRAKYFIALTDKNHHLHQLDRLDFRSYLLTQTTTKFKDERTGQLSLF